MARHTMTGPGNRRAVAVCAVVASLAPPALAADKDPIDGALERCLETPSGQTTAGMVECIGAATTAWDRRLNEAYQKAMQALDPRSQDLLRASQRKWLAFRDAEATALNGPWRLSAGTLAQVTTANANLSAVKERAEELSAYTD